MKDRVNILGTEYTIEIHKMSEDKYLRDNNLAGYCCSDIPLIVIADMSDTDHFEFHNDVDKRNYFNVTLRHEIIHAFLNESGLKESALNSGCWSKNEEMIDYFANQFPKIEKAYKDLDIL